MTRIVSCAKSRARGLQETAAELDTAPADADKPINLSRMPIAPCRGFDQIAAASSEDVEIASVRITRQDLLNRKSQASYGGTHVGVASGDPNPDAARNLDHRHRSSSRTHCSTSTALSRSTQTRQPPPSSISMTPALARCAGGEEDDCRALLEIGRDLDGNESWHGIAAQPTLARLSTSSEQQAVSQPVPARATPQTLRLRQGELSHRNSLAIVVDAQRPTHRPVKYRAPCATARANEQSPPRCLSRAASPASWGAAPPRSAPAGPRRSHPACNTESRRPSSLHRCDRVAARCDQMDGLPVVVVRKRAELRCFHLTPRGSEPTTGANNSRRFTKSRLLERGCIKERRSAGTVS